MKHLLYTYLMWILSLITLLSLNVYIIIKHHDSNCVTLSLFQVRTEVIIISILLLLQNIERTWSRKVSTINY